MYCLFSIVIFEMIYSIGICFLRTRWFKITLIVLNRHLISYAACMSCFPFFLLVFLLFVSASMRILGKVFAYIAQKFNVRFGWTSHATWRWLSAQKFCHLTNDEKYSTLNLVVYSFWGPKTLGRQDILSTLWLVACIAYSRAV